MATLNDKFLPKSESTSFLHQIKTQLFIMDCLELAPHHAQRQMKKALNKIEANSTEGKVKAAVEQQPTPETLSPEYLKQELKRVTKEMESEAQDRKDIHKAPVDGYEIKKARKGKAIENATIRKAELTEIFATCFSREDVVEIASQIKIAAKRGEKWAIELALKELMISDTSSSQGDKPTQAIQFVINQTEGAPPPVLQINDFPPIGQSHSTKDFSVTDGKATS